MASTNSVTSGQRERADALFRRRMALPVPLHPPALQQVICGEEGEAPGTATGLGAMDVLVLTYSTAVLRSTHADHQWVYQLAARHLDQQGSVVLVSTPANRPFRVREVKAHSQNLQVHHLHDWSKLAALCDSISVPSTTASPPCVPLVVVSIHTQYLQEMERFTAAPVPLMTSLLALQARLRCSLILSEMETTFPSSSRHQGKSGEQHFLRRLADSDSLSRLLHVASEARRRKRPRGAGNGEPPPQPTASVPALPSAPPSAFDYRGFRVGFVYVDQNSETCPPPPVLLVRTPTAVPSHPEEPQLLPTPCMNASATAFLCSITSDEEPLGTSGLNAAPLLGYRCVRSSSFPWK